MEWHCTIPFFIYVVGVKCMIPKIIHYVWLGEKKQSKLHKKVLKSWAKRAPEFEIIKWDEESIQKLHNSFLDEALKNKAYAFASDYIRLYALEKYGGIYMDLDMILVKNPLEALKNFDLVFSIQDSRVIFQTSFIAANPHNPFIADCLNFYKDYKFESENMIPNSELLTPILLRNYPFMREDKTQVINNVCAYNSEILLQPSFNSIAIHIGETSWKNATKHDKIRIMLRQNLTNQFEAGVFKFFQDIGRKLI